MLGFVLYSVLCTKEGGERERKRNIIQFMKIKYIVQQKQYQHLASIASFSSPPPVDLGGTAPRDVRLSHFPVGLLLFSAFFSPPLLLFFSYSLFFSFFFFFLIPTLLHGDFLHLFYSSVSSSSPRYNSILTHPCRIDYCFRPASTAAVQ